jgi:hypothetical protein
MSEQTVDAMREYQVVIRGEHVEDDGYRQDLECAEGQAWYEVALPACPDCGGDLVWWEAGYAPGTRRCLGRSIGTRGGQPAYREDGGCGSLFSVQCCDGRVWLQRERGSLVDE